MNPFDLPGPQFLVFYLIVGLVTLGVMWFRQSDAEDDGRPRGLGVSDPYLVAYLRGGPNEAVRVAVVTLVDRDLMETHGDRVMSRPGATKTAQHPLERAVLEYFEASNPAHASFENTARFEARWAAYDTHLRQIGLIPDPTTQDRRGRRLRLAIGTLFVVAGIKLVVAIGRGRTNIWFLIALAVLFTLVAWKIAAARRTTRGDRVLKDLRTLFSRLKERAGTLTPGGGTRDVALLGAVFGVGALPFPWVKQIYPKAKSRGSKSCGSSCGSSCGGGGCGGGCGGCES